MTAAYTPADYQRAIARLVQQPAALTNINLKILRTVRADLGDRAVAARTAARTEAR